MHSLPDATGTIQASGAAYEIYLILLQQPFDAGDELRDDVAATVDRDGEVRGDLSGGDAKLGPRL